MKWDYRHLEGVLPGCEAQGLFLVRGGAAAALSGAEQTAYFIGYRSRWPN